MYSFLSKYPSFYTPILFGFAGTLLLYVWTLIMTILGFPSPGWLWWALLAIPVTGTILQFGSRRVLHIRAYYLIMFGLLLVTCALVAWATICYGQSDVFRDLAAWGIAVPLALVAIASYVADQRRPSLKRMPCGRYGKLDLRTGLIIDPFYTERSQESATHSRSIMQWTFRLVPLTAGLVLALVRSMSPSGQIAIVGLASVVFATMMASGLGTTLSSLVATARWERAHGKRIHVARNYRVPSSSK